jgi:hypothetical protein
MNIEEEGLHEVNIEGIKNEFKLIKVRQTLMRNSSITASTNPREQSAAVSSQQR